MNTGQILGRLEYPTLSRLLDRLPEQFSELPEALGLSPAPDTDSRIPSGRYSDWVGEIGGVELYLIVLNGQFIAEIDGCYWSFGDQPLDDPELLDRFLKLLESSVSVKEKGK